MLGRLIYVAFVALALLAGGFAFDYIANEPGHLTLDYGDRVYELTLFEASIGLAAVVLALMVVMWIIKLLLVVLRFIFFGEGLERGRERSGFDALAKGLVAVAAGDAKTARKKAEIAERKLERPELTRLLNAQAAELAGEDARAATYYKALMTQRDTAFVGTQGLLGQALRDGQIDRALKLASRAHELNPKDKGTLEKLYMLQSQKYDWAAARKTLSAQVRAGHVPKIEAARREAALILAQSEDAEEEGEAARARDLAIEAARMDPANVEAVTTAARHLIGEGSKRAAAKLITDSWRIEPSSDLAAAFASIEPDEAPAARRRRFDALFALHPENAETRFLTAELALLAEDWAGARKAVEDLRETELSARSCAVMAAVARGTGEPDHVVRGWLARAIGAPRDPGTDSEISHAAMLPLLIEPTAAVPGAAAPGGEAQADDAEVADDAAPEEEDAPEEEERPEPNEVGALRQRAAGETADDAPADDEEGEAPDEEADGQGQQNEDDADGRRRTEPVA